MGSAGSAGKKGFPSGRPAWFRVAAACGAAGLAALVFVIARSEGRVPALPRASFSHLEIEHTMAGFKARTAGFELSKHERTMVDWLERWHMAETGDLSAVSAVEEASRAAGEFKSMARDLASKDASRYLLVGDKLALDFDIAFFEVLDDAKKFGGDSLMASGGEAALEIRRKGGAFLKQCLERGVVGEGGEMNAPRILPQVLFRVRWRLMGGLDQLDGLSTVEMKAYFDFAAAYSRASSVDRRLAAVDWLEPHDASYDAVVARAVVLFDAGRYAEARKELEKGLEQGRDDAVVNGFIRALPL